MSNKLTASPIDKAFLYRLSSEYSLFGEYEKAVFSAFSVVSENAALLQKINELAEHITGCTCEEAKKITLPETGNKKTDLMIPLFILLPSIPIARSIYEKRGFSKVDAISFLNDNFRRCINLTEMNNGFPGIDKIYYGWLCLYVKCEIFDHGIFNFQPLKFSSDIIVLKNKDTLLPVMTKGKYCTNGLVFGSAGCTDESDSFEVSFSETEEAYLGHPAVNGKVSNKAKLFKKSEWECILRSGDDVLNIHIPRNVKLTDENIFNSLNNGFDIARKAFPEYSFKRICCYSWLLDPALKDILGENSNISNFFDKFTIFPVSCNGMGIFGFVFPRNYTSLETLPEDTRLQRELKKMYLNGKHIYVYGGIIV